MWSGSDGVALIGAVGSTPKLALGTHISPVSSPNLLIGSPIRWRFLRRAETEGDAGAATPAATATAGDGEDTLQESSKDIMSDMKVDDVSEGIELNQNEGKAMPLEEQEEQAIKKKYGGILPKKPPLISKDHERAYFDSADWALGKGGHAQKPKGPLEALRPKLQPTPQQQVRSRRSVYASTENDDGVNAASEGVNENNGDNNSSDQ
ncbi:hypothetical protein C4D60_Mb06t23220 [Musa balbisiana]|uniref:Negatively light-regulated protein n=1 Tax=Musa balbisiana TaxID=52838 RepID=A0A4S8IQ29_MUSBA|nr:hypothetical protein C4D60_Mb06t23220 [Musa balbisiana]